MAAIDDILVLLEDNVAPSDALIQGNLTLSGSAQQLTANVCRNVVIQANPSNANFVYVGNANTVSSTVHIAALSAGSSIELSITNTNLAWVLGTNGEKISFGGEV